VIVFDLKCLDGGHVFEGWFGSSADYESQRQRGLIQCPLCATARVEKAVMAPRLNAKANQGEAVEMPSDPKAVKAMMAKLATLQKKVLEGSEHVGERFADEARAIHLGEADARAIHGRATRAETDSLIEDGIPVSPLPFPVPEPGEEN
jgi:hypothetical protein